MLHALHSAAQASAERQRVAFERLSPAEKTAEILRVARGGRS